MKAKKLIELLEKLVKDHGNLTVQVKDFTWETYFNLFPNEVKMVIDSKKKRTIVLNHR